MTILAKQRTIVILWMLSTFACMCVLSESLRRDFHARSALLHHSEDLCPETWN